MPISSEAITKTYVDDGHSLERVAHRKFPAKIAIVEPNPAWPQRFQEIKARIEHSLSGSPDSTSSFAVVVVVVQHAGSTSVPGLPAKDIIDVDLVVQDPTDEDAYVDALQRAGFRFLFREPGWHQHRFFVDEDGPSPVNLHVFGPDCPEVERHRIFRDWLTNTPADLELYARVKREAAAASSMAGESMRDYTARKDQVIGEILNRAFRHLGYLQ